MTNPMPNAARLRLALCAATVVLALALCAAPARACQEDVQHAATDLAKLKARAPKVKPKDRARFGELIKQATANLAVARKDCGSAKNVLDRAVATAKVASVRASMAEASALAGD